VLVQQYHQSLTKTLKNTQKPFQDILQARNTAKASALLYRQSQKQGITASHAQTPNFTADKDAN
jgi:hypothetical protein